MSKLGISNLGGLANPSFKNKIINGDFSIWQRGTSFVSPATVLTSDRWKYGRGGNMRHTILRDTDTPTQSESGHVSNYSVKIDCTTVDAAIAAGDYCVFSYDVEGYDYTSLVGETTILSFWVKATKTGIYCISFRNSGLDRSYVIEYTINSSDTWEKKEVTITFNETGGTWNYTIGRGIRIDWTLACGSTYQTTPDAWQNGNFAATSNQVNACDNVANNFWLSQIQFEVGSFTTPFENRPIGVEIAMCQRYYEKSYIYGTVPGTAATTGALFWNEPRNNNNFQRGMERYKVRKRTTPTCTAYSPATGNSARVRNYTTGVDMIQNTMDLISETNFGRFNATLSANDQAQLALHWTADAEL